MHISDAYIYVVLVHASVPSCVYSDVCVYLLTQYIFALFNRIPSFIITIIH